MSTFSAESQSEESADLEHKLEAVIENDEGKAVEMAERLLEGLREEN